MTNKQIQCLLMYLGYYFGNIDGDYGPLTRDAVILFQDDYGIAVDGICGNITQKALRGAVSGAMQKANSFNELVENTVGSSWWDEIKYFTREEFRCPCGKCSGFPVEPQECLVRLADKVRAHFGKAAHVTSGVRCRQHNDELQNSAKNSKHLSGSAVDFYVEGVSGAMLDAFIGSFPEIKYHYRINGGNTVHMNI